MKKEIAKVFVFRSGSNADTIYQTLQYSDGSTSCDCKGWTIKRRTTPNGERSCKHTRLVDLGMAETTCVRCENYLPVVAVPRFNTQAQPWRQTVPATHGRRLYLNEV